MLSWARRGRVPLVCGIAAPEQRAALEDLSGALGQPGSMRMHDPGVASLAHPDLAAAATILIAVADAATLPLAGRLAGARAGAAGEILVLAEDPLVQIDLRDLDAGLPPGLRVRPVSRTVLAARRLFANHPPDRVLRMDRPGDALTLAIAGTGDALAAQLLLEALRLLQLPAIRPAVQLVGSGMPALLERLRHSLPELEQCGAIDAATKPHPIGTPALIVASDGTLPDSDLRALDPAGVAPVLRVAPPSWPAVGRALRGGEEDRIARAVHALHLEERRAAGSPDGERPSQVPWEALPERFREASRHQASHIAVKLRWAGARIVRDATATFGWTAAELAALTEAEHARWSAVSRLEGWSFAPVRDDAAKTTPLLVPFADLAPEIRDLDALPVRAAPLHLGAPVRRDAVVQLALATEPPGPGFEAGFKATLGTLAEPALVLRLTDETASSQAAAAVAHRAGVPFQLTLATPPVTAWAQQAERFAIGAGAASLLAPAARTLRLGADGRIVA